MTPIQGCFDEAREYAHTGMLDWLTLRIDISKLPESVIYKLRSLASRLFKINPEGAIEWESYCWESVRSDTHQVCVRIGSDLWIQGSPARVGQLNNMFGSLDIRYCAHKMIHFAQTYLELDALPEIEHWVCSRIDITRNYEMASAAEARQVLAVLKQTPDARQKISYEPAGLYSGKGSSLQVGKVYLKGQDARRMQRAGKATYTEEELAKADKIVRAELALRRHRIRRLREEQGIHWHELSPDHLLNMHTEYFEEFFSEMEIADMSNILEKLMKIAPTEGRARAAYDCYTRIRLIGYEQAKVSYSKTAWYRHIGFLKAIGMSRADLNSINVVPLRKRAIELKPVRHWDDIRVA